ncbi:flagellar hook-length control protein FliK [Massilia sp.]|uniref:flagellar hook-length control protein FliK n=1 Tax=Massilia sp. TaxID=1882437 RepID=UPI0028987CC1|nr:flagellar hook-length control protein FliK [Massilia sp.]
MTMQTNSLPFQVSGANALNGTNATQRNSSADKPAENSSSGFGATFSRELAQRQQPQPAAPAPAPAPAQQPKPAQQGSKPAQADKPASREPAHQAAAKPAADGAPKTAKADSKGSAEESGDAASAAEAAEAATTPVTDMLAFMASLQQPAANAAVATNAAAGGSAVEAQLTALENAMKNLKGSATGADGAAVTTDDSGAGLKLATGVVPAATDAVAAQQDVALQGQDGQQDAAQFGAHLREAQQSVPAAAEETAPPLAQLQAQAAKLAEVQNPAAAGGDRIPARVGSQAWDNQVSQRIVYMIGKESAATLTLNPPDLGPVQVVLNVSNDQATVAFSSQQLEVRQALENAMPRLREMMSESGIALGNATVDAGAANQQGSQNNERRAEGGNGNGGGNGLAGTGQGDAAVNEVAPRATRTVALGDRGMVDLFA